MGDKAYSQPIRNLKKYVPLDSLDALDKAEREWNPYMGTFVIIDEHKHVVGRLLCRDERSEKNEPTKAFSASDVGNVSNAAVGRMRCSCCYTHTHPTNGDTYTRPTNGDTYTRPTN
jgi:hypothetical protein